MCPLVKLLCKFKSQIITVLVHNAEEVLFMSPEEHAKVNESMVVMSVVVKLQVC